MKIRAAILLTVFSLLLSLPCAAAAEGEDPLPFSDVPSDAWYAPYVQVCYEKGLMEGTGEGRFSPDGVLLVAEAEALCARLHNILNGGDGTLPPAPEGTGSVVLTGADGETVPLEWISSTRYADSTQLDFSIQIDSKLLPAPPERIQLTVDHSAVFYGQIDTPPSNWTWDYTFSVTEEERDLFAPYVKLGAAVPFGLQLSGVEDAWFWSADRYLRSLPGAAEKSLNPFLLMPARRQDLFELLSFILPEDALEPINQFRYLTGGDPQVLPFYRAGILTGVDSQGSFDGQSSLTRAEAAAMLARVIDPSLRVAFTQDPFPNQQYTLTWLADGTGDIYSTGLCSCFVEETGESFLLNLEGERIPWPEGRIHFQSVTFSADSLDIGVMNGDPSQYGAFADIQYGVMDRNGEFVVPLGAYDYVKSAQDGTFLARSGGGGEETWFLLNHDGTLCAQLPRLDGAGWSWEDLNNGLLPLLDTESGLMGFVDRTGSWVIEPRWQSADSRGFISGYAIVQDQSGLSGVIDRWGGVVLPCRYQEIVPIVNSPSYIGGGLFGFTAQDGTSGWISPEGNMTPRHPNYRYDEFHNGYVRAYIENDTCCYMDQSGMPVSEIFDWAGPIGPDGRGFAGLDGAIYRIEFQP